jgi:hypothetical protein
MIALITVPTSVVDATQCLTPETTRNNDPDLASICVKELTMSTGNKGSVA